MSGDQNSSRRADTGELGGMNDSRQGFEEADFFEGDSGGDDLHVERGADEVFREGAPDVAAADLVAHLQAEHIGAHLIDGPTHFMPKAGGEAEELRLPGSSERFDVRTADADPFDLDADFLRARLGNRSVSELDAIGLTQDRDPLGVRSWSVEDFKGRLGHFTGHVFSILESFAHRNGLIAHKTWQKR